MESFSENIQEEIDLKLAYFLVDKSLEPAFCLGEYQQFIYVNDAICRMTEYSREELLSMRIYDLDIDFDIHSLLGIESEYYSSFKSRYLTKRKGIFIVETSIIYLERKGIKFGCAVLRYQSDGVIGCIQEALNTSKILTLLETIEAGIFLIQSNRIRYINPAAEKLTGYKKQELLNDFHIHRLITGKKPRQLYLEKQSVDLEYQEINILAQDGTERCLIGVVTNLDGMFNLLGKASELIICIDITDYKNLESNLNQALEQAKELSELKAHFVSMVCHQFRTPLNIISFCNSLIAEKVDLETKKEILLLLENIEKAIAQISQMLDDMLLFSQAQAAKINFAPQPLELVEFCHNLVAGMHMIMSQNRINFISKVELIKGYVDPKLLDYILRNLLENALKYSPYYMRVDFILDCDQEQLIFQIKDQGIGIPFLDQKRLFERFYRGNNIGDIPGNGLGLSIIKTLVDLHGGQVKVESEVDIGTSITVILPLIKEASFL
jgi:PAS domain S-box-containing protein